MEVIATGLNVPEGPAINHDGAILFTEQTAGRITRIDPSGTMDVFAVTGGSPNACAIGPSGHVYVCQNGGIVGRWRSSDPRTPSIQIVDNIGRVSTLITTIDSKKLRAPNDLAFGPDKRLYFTDPAQAFDPNNPEDDGTIFSLTPDASESTTIIRVGGVYCNGIAFGKAGQLFWVESYTRKVCTLDAEGSARVLCQLPDGHIPDGFTVAEDGRLFIATCGSHMIDEMSPDGEVLDTIFLDDRANPTNCCFLGGDLIVTDFCIDFEKVPAAGRLWRVPTDAVGLPDSSRAETTSEAAG